MEKFSSEEIESQYNLIKMLLSEHEKNKNTINAIRKILLMSQSSLKKTLGKNILF